jgi:CBS-domain-containing membrane protein
MAVTAIIFWILSLRNSVLVASLGATAFIIFCAPSSPPAQPVRCLGGQAAGCIFGGIGVLLLNYWSVDPVIIYSLMIGLSFFLMVSLDLYHPPAAGTALGIAIADSYSRVLITVILAVIFLLVFRRLLKKYLKDLV